MQICECTEDLDDNNLHMLVRQGLWDSTTKNLMRLIVLVVLELGRVALAVGSRE